MIEKKMTNQTENFSEKELAHQEAMKALKAEQDRKVAAAQPKSGLLMVHTGDGKGKSTSAFGMIIRALGWGHSAAIVQFIKGDWETGEHRFFQLMGDQLEFHVMGEGFTWDTQNRARDIAAAEKAWETVKTLLSKPSLNLLVLDELNIAIHYEYLDITTVLKDLRARNPNLHVCITGRNAHPDLMAAADLVTEMKAIKHPFDQGILAQAGVDY
jgi:cob(I)alamin adenosyltransferase